MKLLYILLMLILNLNINSSILINVNDLINNQNKENNNGILTIIHNDNYNTETFKCNTTQLNNSHIITYTDCIINPKTKTPYKNIIYNQENNQLGKIYINIEGFENQSNYKRGLDDKLTVSLNIIDEIAILKFNNYLVRNNCYFNRDKIRVTKGDNKIIITNTEINQDCIQNRKIEPYIWYNIELNK